MDLSATFIQYGVPSEWANLYAKKKLSVNTFKNTSQKNLTDRYGISKEQIRLVKPMLKRIPIEEGILQELLHNNRFVCCMCRGTKGPSYIIHHIESYADSQNNSYYNLAVLCPADHDLVHKEGKHITQKITKEQVRKAKERWEEEVERLDVQLSARNLEITEVDFLNIPRIVPLYQQIFKKLPETEESDILQRIKALNPSGELNPTFIKKHNTKRTYTPLNFHGPSGAYLLSSHFTDAFKQILSELEFLDLDDMLNSKFIRENELVNKFCFFVGGLYVKTEENALTDGLPLTKLHFHRRQFSVEWLVDRTYMVSNSSLARLSRRGQYLIYGRIRNVDQIMIKDKKGVHIDIRPYLFGIPSKQKSRTPGIHYKQKYSDKYF